MVSWKEALLHVAVDAENHYDKLKAKLANRLGRDPIMIQPYLGYGTSNRLYLKGRVLENKGVSPATDNDTLWKNLHNMYLRFASDEIAQARVNAAFEDQQITTVADAEGYFDVEINLQTPIKPTQHWVDVHLDLVDYPGQRESAGAQASGAVLVPPPDAQFGVISDIDDTVLQSDVIHVLRMARNVFLENSHTRLPFAGVAAFYRALQAGGNPIFYLSSSPWNLYDLLVDFFDLRRIPLGPLMLTDLGLTPTQMISPSHKLHKQAWITRLMETYTALPFILLGDSSQKDPEIYLDAALKNPGRILAIYIRDASGDRRDRAVRKLIEQAQAEKIDMLFVKDTAEAARHALAHHYIAPESLDEIDQECDEDHRDPLPLEKLLSADEDSV
ncbi:MAG: DUF2183 domain-containing protein [Anaerolineae bacterium]|nr:DUF2183 domain-containing protein [Anaerolineae bacterium]